MTPCRVVILGRPNVGKSTLFNRLVGRRRSLVHNLPGVTRDRIEEKAEWWVRGRKFPVSVTDTGGLSGDIFSKEIKDQVYQALHKANVVLFVLDSQTGPTPTDQELLRDLQKSGIIKKLPVIAVINKVDAESHETRINDFYGLGLDLILTVSSEHDRGMDDLKEAIVEQVGFPDAGELEKSSESSIDLSSNDLDGQNAGSKSASGEINGEIDGDATEKVVDRIPRIAIIGRPNVGKSTLLNTLLGENRVITSPIAGTTVDSVDVTIQLDGKPFTLIDTAGIRRKSKTEQGVEVLSVLQARKTLERTDIAILVLDAETGTCDQDEKIGGLIVDAGCCVVLALNKWDTQKRNPEFTKEHAAERIRRAMAYLKYAPIIFTSGLKGEGLENLGSLLEEILHQRRLKIPTHEFTEWVRKEATVHNPMNAKFFLCHQTGKHPPTFVCHVNDPDKIHFSLQRHLVNALRDKWGYMGSPVRVLFVEGKNRRSLPKPLSTKKSKMNKAKDSPDLKKAPRGTSRNSPSKK